MMENLIFRKAAPEDKPAMLAICAQIWDGDDYIPYVWDEWLAEPYGQLSVVELDGKVVGMGKLTRLAPEEWWLEGLRVDPAYRERGIGRFLHQQGVALAERIGSGVLRFATSSANTSVHHFAEETGFQHIGDYVLFKGEPITPDAEPGFTPLTNADLGMVEHFLETSERFTQMHRLFENRWWTWQTLTLDLMEDYIERGGLLGWRLAPPSAPSLSGRGAGEGGLSGLALIHPYSKPYSKEEDQLIVSYADAHGALLADLARDLRRLAAVRGLSAVNWKAFRLPTVMAALEAAGYENTWENTLRLYERPIGSSGRRAADGGRHESVEARA